MGAPYNPYPDVRALGFKGFGFMVSGIQGLGDSGFCFSCQVRAITTPPRVSHAGCMNCSMWYCHSSTPLRIYMSYQYAYPRQSVSSYLSTVAIEAPQAVEIRSCPG